jgi:hypothetical protein
MDLGLANAWRREIARLYRALEAVYRRDGREPPA